MSNRHTGAYRDINGDIVIPMSREVESTGDSEYSPEGISDSADDSVSMDTASEASEDSTGDQTFAELMHTASQLRSQWQAAVNRGDRAAMEELAERVEDVEAEFRRLNAEIRRTINAPLQRVPGRDTLQGRRSAPPRNPRTGRFVARRK